MSNFLRRPFRFITLALLCGLMVWGCNQTTMQVPTQQTGSDRIVLGTTATVNTLDPADAYSSFTGALLYNLGDRLYTYKLGTTELAPQLATALPTVSADGLTYTIPLRRDVVFHDGTPFNAAAMAFSIQRFVENGGSPAFLISPILDTVEATGEYELTLRLKEPFAAFPSLLAFSGLCAVSPNAYEIKEGAFLADQFVGTGPYRLTEVGTDRLRLTAFEDYWGPQPTNAGVDVQLFSSPANLFNAFRTGLVDVAYQDLALAQIKALQDGSDQAGWQILKQSGSGIDYLTLNLRSPPLDQLPVRQALAALVDRPLLEERVFQGLTDPLYSLIPSDMPGQQPVFKTTFGDRNTEKARQLLTEAGFSAENPLRLEFWYRSNITNDQYAAITLKAIAQRQLPDLVQLELNSIESTTAYKNLENGVYPIFLLDWAPDFFDPDNYIEPFLSCAEGSPTTGCTEGSTYLQGSFYYSDRANQLIAQSRQAQDPQQRAAIFGEIQQLLVDDVPFIPLWQNVDYLFVQPWVQGASLEVTKKVPFWGLQK